MRKIKQEKLKTTVYSDVQMKYENENLLFILEKFRAILDAKDKHIREQEENDLKIIKYYLRENNLLKDKLEELHGVIEDYRNNKITELPPGKCCPACGKPIEKYTYCSKACAAIGHAAKRREWQKANLDKARLYQKNHRERVVAEEVLSSSAQSSTS
jgi:predicted nucleic acid-binding Zn ribbon protein